MTLAQIKPTLIMLHRWIGLALTPLFLLIALSGAILAFKPILEQERSSPNESKPDAVELSRVASLIDSIDPLGGEITAIKIDNERQQLVVRSQSSELEGHYDLTTGERTTSLREEPTGDIFGFAKRLHKGLLLDLRIVVEVATYLTLFTVVVAPLLAWPRWKNNLTGWHRGIGWVLLPLLVMLPLTGVLMTLHVGMPKLPGMSERGISLSINQALQIASGKENTGYLTRARKFRGGSVLLAAKEPQGEQLYIITDTAMTAINPQDNLIKSLHEGTLAGSWSGLLNLLGAIALSLLVITGCIAWFRRSRQSARRMSNSDADILVAYASQTGTAARLAQATVNALQASGTRIALASIGTLLPQEMSRYRDNLLLVSTTGEGNIPDSAQVFLKSLNGCSLTGSRFSLLALGDRRYQHFCGGAETLRKELLASGAAESLPMQRIDGKPEGIWHEWLTSIAETLKLEVDNTVTLPQEQEIRVILKQRQRLDTAGMYGRSHPSYSLLLKTESQIESTAGDLLLIAPKAYEKERCYSIGSSSYITPGHIRLTISLHQWRDDQGTQQTGSTSDMLCRQLREGDEFTARVRQHPGFHAPKDDSRPLILIGTGCGIAPFIGFIEEREHAVNAGPLWLFYGNRWREIDYLYGDQIESLHAMGVITKLDCAFSRDQVSPCYVNHKLHEQGAELTRWLIEDDAALYICGRGSTLGKSIDQALKEILSLHTDYSASDIDQLIIHWSASGKLRRDLFD